MIKEAYNEFNNIIRTKLHYKEFRETEAYWLLEGQNEHFRLPESIIKLNQDWKHIVI
jgi:hypothetical protein